MPTLRLGRISCNPPDSAASMASTAGVAHSAGSQVAAVAGLVAAGVGLGGVMVCLGFARYTGDKSAAVQKLSKVGRRGGLRHKPSDIDDSETPTSDGSGRRVRHERRRRRAVPLRAALANLEDAAGVGFSMEEALMMAESGQAAAMTRSPADVLAELQRGNVRFWTGQAWRPEKSAFERRALISRQFPSTAILGCSDSRVPIEIVFDQGLGDLFVIRVAGNCLDTATCASLQYAVHHLKVKLVVVMGHEGCGAVKAAQLPLDAIDKEPEPLGKLLLGMRKGLDAADLTRIQDGRAADREAVTTNVKAQVETLARDEGIMDKVRSGELMMCGAMYEISSGIVDFFHEISGIEDATSPVRRAPSRGVMSRWCPTENQLKTEV